MHSSITRMRLIVRLASLLGPLATITAVSGIISAEPPDPVALLRGVEAARSAIRTGDIEMRIVSQRFLLGL